MWNVLYLFLNHKQFEELGRSLVQLEPSKLNGLCSQMFKGKSTGNPWISMDLSANMLFSFRNFHPKNLEPMWLEEWHARGWWMNRTIACASRKPSLPSRTEPGKPTLGDGRDPNCSGESSHLTSAPLKKVESPSLWSITIYNLCL